MKSNAYSKSAVTMKLYRQMGAVLFAPTTTMQMMMEELVYKRPVQAKKSLRLTADADCAIDTLTEMNLISMSVFLTF